MSEADLQMLDAVFGPGPGTTPEERAAQSKQIFVRGLDLLTFDHSAKARGRRLTAQEALEAYEFDKLCEVVQTDLPSSQATPSQSVERCEKDAINSGSISVRSPRRAGLSLPWSRLLRHQSDGRFESTSVLPGFSAWTSA